jgi:glycosyltransferase involved in cell wall biosynthesis
MSEDRHAMEDFWGGYHPFGVSFLAPWEDPFSGFPEHARRSAVALDLAGCPVHLQSFDGMQQLDALVPGQEMVEERVGHLLDAKIGQAVAIVNMFVPTPTRLHNTVNHAKMEAATLRIVNSCRAIYTVWERQNLPPTCTEPLNAAGQAWVACQDNADMLVRGGVKPEKVKVVPCPYFPNDAHLKLDGRPQRHPSKPVVFYHIGKWEPRKEHDRIMGAFLCAFRPGEAILYLKTSSHSPEWPGYPRDPIRSVHEWLRQGTVIGQGWTLANVNSGIHLIRTMLPHDELVRLHRSSDVYVNLSRGEGFDMPALDAKLAGNLMVFVRGGGPADFFGEQDEAVEPTGTVLCNPGYRWEPDATYLDYSMNDAIRALRNAYEKVKAGKRCRGRDLSPWGVEAVGRQMRSFLEELHGVKDFP